jgi:hypothetical protein
LKSNVEPNAVDDLSSSSFVFTFDDNDEAFEEISWTEPDFGFGASVTYSLQIDKAGADFGNAYELTSTSGTSAVLTIGEINSALLALGLTPDQAADVEIRVVSTISGQVAPLQSTTLNVTMTPYATTFPPIYIVGDAQGWNLDNALELQSTGPGTYEATGIFQLSGKFRFFATPSWDAEQYRASTFAGGTISNLISSAGDGDSNFIFNGATGYYKINVNLTTKTIAIEAASAPTMYIIGDVQGWNLGNALEMNSLGGGQFEVIGQFNQDAIFRFFVSPDWAADQYRWSSFAGGTVDTELSDGGGSDSNFKFAATSGIYKVVLSVNDKTITVEPVAEPTLYIIGDDQGWNLNNAFKLTWLGGGKYQGTTTFTNNKIFRFFDKPDWSAGFGNYPYFEDGEISDLFENGGGNDSNFLFIGATGSYTVNVDLYNLKVEMSQ